MNRRVLAIVLLNLALFPWTVASVAWAVTVTPDESRAVRALLVVPLKYVRPFPGIRLWDRRFAATDG